MVAAWGGESTPTEITTPEAAAAASADGGGLSENVGVLVGAIVMFGVAAFMPFVLFRLLPMAEGALVAQGVEGRTPAGRAAGLQRRHDRPVQPGRHRARRLAAPAHSARPPRCRGRRPWARSRTRHGGHSGPLWCGPRVRRCGPRQVPNGRGGAGGGPAGGDGLDQLCPVRPEATLASDDRRARRTVAERSAGIRHHRRLVPPLPALSASVASHRPRPCRLRRPGRDPTAARRGGDDPALVHVGASGQGRCVPGHVGRRAAPWSGAASLLAVVLHLGGAPLLAARPRRLRVPRLAKLQAGGRPLREWVPLLAAWAAARFTGRRSWLAPLPLLPGGGTDMPPMLRGVDIVDIPTGSATLGRGLRSPRRAGSPRWCVVRGAQFACQDDPAQAALIGIVGRRAGQHRDARAARSCRSAGPTPRPCRPCWSTARGSRTGSLRTAALGTQPATGICSRMSPAWPPATTRWCGSRWPAPGCATAKGRAARPRRRSPAGRARQPRSAPSEQPGLTPADRSLVRGLRQSAARPDRPRRRPRPPRARRAGRWPNGSGWSSVHNAGPAGGRRPPGPNCAWTGRSTAPGGSSPGPVDPCRGTGSRASCRGASSGS